MLRSRQAVLTLAVALIVGSGCGSAAGQVATETETTSTAAPPKRVVLSLRDHGRTVAVTRRTKIVLWLAGRYRWSRPRSGGAIAANEVLSDEPTKGQTWELKPLRTGTAVLRSTGTPACRPSAAGCPKTARRFVLTFVVRA
jgi:hypothetical protein